MKSRIALNKKRARRAHRVRAKVQGTGTRPRLSIFRSNRYLWAQLIDDEKGRTLVSASTKGMKEVKTKVSQATRLGSELAKHAKEKGIAAAVFDRHSYRYHGRVKALAEAAREGGLTI